MPRVCWRMLVLVYTSFPSPTHMRECKTRRCFHTHLACTASPASRTRGKGAHFVWKRISSAYNAKRQSIAHTCTHTWCLACVRRLRIWISTSTLFVSSIMNGKYDVPPVRAHTHTRAPMRKQLLSDYVLGFCIHTHVRTCCLSAACRLAAEQSVRPVLSSGWWFTGLP